MVGCWQMRRHDPACDSRCCCLTGKVMSGSAPPPPSLGSAPLARLLELGLPPQLPAAPLPLPPCSEAAEPPIDFDRHASGKGPCACAAVALAIAVSAEAVLRRGGDAPLVGLSDLACCMCPAPLDELRPMPVDEWEALDRRMRAMGLFDEWLSTCGQRCDEG